ncbi:MAG: hypothetical protein ABW123_22870 [Cystobacter sp.]
MANPITICDWANAVLGREARTGEDFEEAGLDMLGGCQGCGASLAAYNAHPSKTGFWQCRDCIGDLGFATVAEAEAFVAARGE